ncbi:MAG: ATP-binding protein [Dysgonamonadaceae bacterium]|jgi:AAA+ ATPase superfamily predicted ATPase|nr:ATP-binding protein [Dysgonamonadaceae bacterium]
MLKFYNREKETALLLKTEQLSIDNAQMTFVVGRRRIGKTSLLINVFAGKRTVYFFVEKKNEALLCEEFIEEIQNKLGVTVFGQMRTFKDVFGYLMNFSENQHFTLIIDEFQEFRNINASIYSEMQNIWDKYKNNSKLNLILCGSVYSLMKQIFENSKEPLFGRATARLHLKTFDIKTLKEILADYYPKFTNEDLLAFYLFTGGVAKYVELLTNTQAFTMKKIVNEILSESSLFLNEGKNVLIEEFGKDYGNYFSILMLIASSKTSRAEMESVMNVGLGGFLEKLENEFGLISKLRPILSKPAGKSVKYRINDNFLNFWFRFIYKYRGAIEMENFDYVKNIIARDYTTYSGQILERYFREKLSVEENLSAIGSYWETGNQNEIDIVALNEYEKRAIIVEVKRQSEKINLNTLQNKSKNLIDKLKGYDIEYRALSIENM